MTCNDQNPCIESHGGNKIPPQTIGENRRVSGDFVGGAQRQFLELKPELKLVISIYPQADAGSAVTQESQLIQKFTAINTEINTEIQHL